MTVRGLKREGEREKTEIGLLVCCALLCCEHVIRLKMSLVQSGTPGQRGIVGIYVCALMRCTHNFGGLKRAESLRSLLEGSLSFFVVEMRTDENHLYNITVT